MVQDLDFCQGNFRPIYDIINAPTVKVIIDEYKPRVPIGALNFASAKNPGGGFLKGAIAQEESLALSSGLYSTQLRNKKFYEENRKCKSMMYTDYAIYSPEVAFFRDEKLDLLESIVTASVLTLPAVNMSQVRAKREDAGLAKKVMKSRMRIALAILAYEKNKTIILGAYGCGVFGNNPNDVAQWWRDILIDEGYENFFEKILFAILDKPNGTNIRAFERTFGEEVVTC